MQEHLTPALEDYLEVILQLSEENGKATISDIARRLNIAKPSANQAISSLRRGGMVVQERYGPVYLTETGREKAEKIWRRHRIIRNFLQNVLNVSASVAEHDACMMEHVISPETLDAMKNLIADRWPAENTTAAQLCLADLKPGERARITRVNSQKPQLRKRIMEMGLLPGTVVELERFAPLGDPLELAINDYHLSLRKEEAAFILVEQLQDEA